jgi:hypothetical protein
MIKLFLVFSLLFLCSTNLLLAQSEDSNLVVNPSFENFHFNKTQNNKFNPYRLQSRTLLDGTIQVVAFHQLVGII